MRWYREKHWETPQISKNNINFLWTMFLAYTPATKCQKLYWKHPTSTLQKKQGNRYTRKIISVLFYGIELISLGHPKVILSTTILHKTFHIRFMIGLVENPLICGEINSKLFVRITLRPQTHYVCLTYSCIIVPTLFATCLLSSYKNLSQLWEERKLKPLKLCIQGRI